MTGSSPWLVRVLILVVAFALCGGPEAVQAQTQSSTTPAASQTSAAQPSGQQNQTGSTPESATPDPTVGPLQPAQNPLPNAPSSSRQAEDQEGSATSPAPAQKQQPAPQQRQEQPLGAGAAQTGPTAGGAASKPAGTAIAPSKQKQRRSLLIKVGAIAGAAAALGAVYALSRGTPSTPPGANRTAATQPGR